MKVYHQMGFRDKWNIDCLKSGIGDGLIFSPINMDSDKLLALPKTLREISFLDPQFYLLNKEKSTNITYPFFPGNIKTDFSTADLDVSNSKLAEICIDYQINADLDYIIIPTRYVDAVPTRYLEQMAENFVYPFLEVKEQKNITKSFLLTVVVKQIMVEDKDKLDELLNWMTGISNIAGFYLIFENNFTSKQIKNFDYLTKVLFFIDILKRNEFEVHIGYCNTEALIYSAAMPDSITIGSYENLRMFRISRFEMSEGKPMHAPNARLYSSKLLQWMDYNYIESMKSLINNYDSFFDDTQYKPLMFSLGEFKNQPFSWHFAKSEIYKHYFEVFYSLIKSLVSDQFDRIEQLKSMIKTAIDNYKVIEDVVLLDSDSDGSHLATWYNVLNSYKKNL